VRLVRHPIGGPDALAPEPQLPRSRLAVGVSGDAEGLRAQVVGEIDLATAPRLVARLGALRRHTAAISLDLTGVTFMDVSGLHALLNAQRDASESGVQIRLVAPGHACALMLERTHSGDADSPG
jgi:anti-sigma B factor antagonist